MRILVVSNLYPPSVMGGYEVQCQQASDALAARGHDVLVLTSQAPGGGRSGAGPRVARSLVLAPVYDEQAMAAHPLVSLQDLEGRSQWIQGHNVATLLEAIDGFRPHVVYLWNTIGLGGLGLLLAVRLRGLPWVWQLADRVPWQLLSERGELVPALVAWWNRMVTGRWVCISRRLEEEHVEAGVDLPGSVARIPAWVVAGAVPPQIPAPAAGRPLRLAFAGQVAGHKGADLAVAAVGQLGRRGVEASLDVWGEVLDPAIPARAAADATTDRIRFHGLVDRLTMLRGVAGCDLLLFPTWAREPFGAVGAEAAAVGTPPVLTDCGLAEWLVDGRHYIHVERSAEAVADAVCRVHDGDVDLPGMAREAAAFVRAELDLEVVVTRLEAELVAAAAEVERPLCPPEWAYGLAVVAEQLVTDVTEQRWG